MVVIGARRWCVQPYHENGCAGFWSLRYGRWQRAAWHTPLIPRGAQ